MKLLAIDPGREKSAWVILKVPATSTRTMTEEIEALGICPNEDLITGLREYRDFSGVGQLVRACWGPFYPEVCVCEWIESYGMPVGKDVFETVFWIGRFAQAWQAERGGFVRLPRSDVKLYLCQNRRAKDSNIRQAIIDRYPATGGGKIPQIGTKKLPGPLYGVRKDIWQALAVGLTWVELQEIRKAKEGK